MGKFWNNGSNYFVIFGGIDSSQMLNDMYKLDVITNIWENVNPVLSIPEKRYNLGSTMMYDTLLHEYFVIYGGAKTNSYLTTLMIRGN